MRQIEWYLNIEPLKWIKGPTEAYPKQLPDVHILISMIFKEILLRLYLTKLTNNSGSIIESLIFFSKSYSYVCSFFPLLGIGRSVW